jgi:hypothetical protein
MEVEKDFIKREIQRLTLLLSALIEKISGLSSKNTKSGIEEVNKALKNEFDLTLLKITKMNNSNLLKHITELHESHIEKLAELMHEIVLKIELSDSNYNKREIALKGILLINFLNEKSKTFSLKRRNIKNTLQHYTDLTARF